MASPQPISVTDFRRLHRATIDSAATIRALLEDLKQRGTWLTSGMDLSVRPRRAQVTEVAADRVTLSLENLDAGRAQLHLNFEVDGSSYFFDARTLGSPAPESIDVALPEAIYRAERRDIPRERQASRQPVDLLFTTGERVAATVVDRSYEGVGVELLGEGAVEVGSELRLEYPAAAAPRKPEFATVRHARRGQGWCRLGLSVTQVPRDRMIPVEQRNAIRTGRGGRRVWRTVKLARAAVSSAPRLLAERLHIIGSRERRVDVVAYKNARGEELKGILDSTGAPDGAPAIVIPPAWGRTKETLLPLAMTLIRTFEAAGESLTVLRYDERQRRGESYIDPACRASGREGLHYTFSGAVEDIHTTTRFLAEEASFRPSRVLLLTVSLASIQGRRAVASDPTGLVGGWVNLVGMPDLQSSMRAVTGGIDWVYGLTQGVRFGPQELVGVMVDMDNAGPDTLRHSLGFFEDARRDMAAITVPVTWLHGRHDGWMSLARVRELMSAGVTENRRLIEVPTGHQLRSSREALETFQLVAEESSQILLGRRLEGQPPDLLELERRRRIERRRRPQTQVDLRTFWHDYLVGKGGIIGMELMTATEYYRKFMELQVSLLGLGDGATVLDLGAGTGDLSIRVSEMGIPGVRVTAVDLIIEALVRGRERVDKTGSGISVSPVVADVSRGGAVRLPFASAFFDAVVASLLVSYIEDPELLLAEAARVVRPGGRIVISSPRRDADISKLFADTTGERRPEQVQQLFGNRVTDGFESHQAEFLNNAARVLELEEDGRFHFYDPDDLGRLLQDSGLLHIETALSFGDPPQFSVAAGTRR